MIIREARLHLAVASLILLMAGFAVDTLACPVLTPDKTQTLSVTMSSGVQTEVSVNFFKGLPDAEDSGSCVANAYIPLSRFPTSRVAARPAQLAAALREIVDEWSAKECTIVIWYENDTNDDLANHELCVLGTFAFDKGDYWSSSSEQSCWEPDEFLAEL